MNLMVGSSIIFLTNIIAIIVAIYVTILIIKMLRRGIKALDIYINKNSSGNATSSDENFYNKYDR